MLVFYIILFIACCIALYFAGNLVLEGVSRAARRFCVNEFVMAFFVMALAASLPNLFLAIMAVANGVPQLSLGDVMGGNVVDMTLAIALAVFFSKKGVSAKGETMQMSLFFTFIAAILPLVLLIDNNLSRIDGLVLMVFFCVYIYWLLSKKERFCFIYSGHKIGNNETSGAANYGKLLGGILILAGVAQSVILLAESFSIDYAISLPLVGTLIVGLGNSLPEIYFGILAAKAGRTKMILGDVMGAIILPGTLVLGLVALLSPIEITDVKMFAVARYFLLLAAIIFYVCARTGQKITKKEALMLLSIYLAFLMIEIFTK
ncbi:MAG: hypothetical protein MUD10_02745 [Candidatus Pacebacteria bacterium]|jgi:cation:H+ antiporter|nr:hypothetical protein [Candidatus Paceibacterota bacterium]